MPFSGFGEIAEKLRRSTVAVRAGRRGQGSGVIVQPGGVIVTNAHVAGAQPVEIELWEGTRARASVCHRDEDRDIALLQTPLSGLPAASLADSGQLRPGELAIAIGNPLGFSGALTRGAIRAIGRVRGLGAMQWVQADVRLAPGNSGGPLANAAGQVVGINTMIAAGLGLAVPSNAVARRLQPEAARSPLGITARPVPIHINGSERVGLMILGLQPSGAADVASLMPGDIICGADGHALDSSDELEQALQGTGDRVVRLQFLRGGRANLRTAAVRLGPRSVAAA